MSGSSFRYLVKEGFRNTWTNRLMSIASIAVLMSCLVLMGCATMVFLNIDSLMSRIEDENVIMVYITDGTSDADIKKMGTDLENTSNIKEVEFVPKEEAWQEQLATMDDAQAKYFTDISTDIPLPDAYKVTVKDLNKFDSTLNSIKKLKHIDTIRENKDLAKKLTTIRHGVEVISITIVVILLIISIFIIQNTIKLTVYSRRLEISIMKSVGATNGFVRLPFMIEGIILGIVSALFGILIVWGLYSLSVRQFSDLLNSLGIQALNFASYAGKMLLAFLGVGIVTGAGGALLSMGRYLNKEGSEISGT